MATRRLRITIGIGLLLVLTGTSSARSAPPDTDSAIGLVTRSMTAPAALTAYLLPLSGPAAVLRPFQPPPTPYAAGHRGVDLATVPGATVRAAGLGTVTFAGEVAGRGLVVIAHPDGLSTEYEPISPLVHRGDPVARGDPIGTVSGAHAACAPASCLHWGARRAEVYLDPLSLLHTLGAVHLIPD